MLELTDRLLNIPMAIATKHAKPDTDAWDELVAVGNLELVRAANQFDAAFGVKPITYLWRCVNLVVARAAGAIQSVRDGVPRDGHVQRWAKLSSLDQALEDAGFIPADAPEVDPSLEADSAALLTHILRGLSPIDRALYRLRHERGLGIKDIAPLMGGGGGDWTPAAVKWRLTHIESYLRRRADAVGRPRGEGNLVAIPPPRSEAQRRAAAAFCHARAVAARLLGDVPRGKYLWYLACDSDVPNLRRIVGPFGNLHDVCRRACVPLESAGRGGKNNAAARVTASLVRAGSPWRLVRGPEAPFLARDGYRLEEAVSHDAR